ncbi:MAG: hypothetical protein CSA83_02280 [Actinomycetales bacterium]|nr:MAG: hypothetical protein CSA83_02280 [Actinomycetales bacterium]
MLADSFGWQITTGYVLAGLGLAILLGGLYSRLNLVGLVHDFVSKTPTMTLPTDHSPTIEDRITSSWEETKEIFGRIWKWVIVGVGIGALIHGWVPAEFLAEYAGPDNPLAVLVVTALGVPLYSNAAGVIPIAEALGAKGMATGTMLSFMMSTAALSLPEVLLLKQVMKPKLLAIFLGSVTVGIMLIGFIFNLLT